MSTESEKKGIEASFKSMDTEEFLDIYFNRPIGYAWALLFKKLKVHPNVVTIFSIILGIGAGVMFYYPDMKHTLIGILLLMWANHYDSADGQLARLTGQKTQWGRMLDGFAGDIWFFTIYAAICLRLMDQPMPFHIGDGMHWGIFIWILAAFSGAAFVTRIRAILLRDTGATLSPFHAFIFLQGLETLSLRVERHVENALKVVDFLKKQPLVEKVNHPSVSEDPEQQALYKKYFPNGGGSIFTFEIKGGAKEAQEFIDQLKLFSLLANVADVKSLVIHPASTTHAELNEAEQAEQGIKPNTIRLSIGTENIDDIIYDLQEAFEAISK